MDIKTKNLVESVALMFFITVIKLAFLGVGAYLLLKDCIGCGITCMIFSFIAGSGISHKDEKEEKEMNEKKQEK